MIYIYKYIYINHHLKEKRTCKSKKCYAGTPPYKTVNCKVLDMRNPPRNPCMGLRSKIGKEVSRILTYGRRPSTNCLQGNFTIWIVERMFSLLQTTMTMSGGFVPNFDVQNPGQLFAGS